MLTSQFDLQMCQLATHFWEHLVYAFREESGTQHWCASLCEAVSDTLNSLQMRNLINDHVAQAVWTASPIWSKGSALELEHGIWAVTDSCVEISTPPLDQDLHDPPASLAVDVATVTAMPDCARHACVRSVKAVPHSVWVTSESVPAFHQTFSEGRRNGNLVTVHYAMNDEAEHEEIPSDEINKGQLIVVSTAITGGQLPAFCQMSGGAYNTKLYVKKRDQSRVVVMAQTLIDALRRGGGQYASHITFDSFVGIVGASVVATLQDLGAVMTGLGRHPATTLTFRSCCDQFINAILRTSAPSSVHSLVFGPCGANNPHVNSPMPQITDAMSSIRKVYIHDGQQDLSRATLLESVTVQSPGHLPVRSRCSLPTTAPHLVECCVMGALSPMLAQSMSGWPLLRKLHVTLANVDTMAILGRMNGIEEASFEVPVAHAEQFYVMLERISRFKFRVWPKLRELRLSSPDKLHHVEHVPSASLRQAPSPLGVFGETRAVHAVVQCISKSACAAEEVVAGAREGPIRIVVQPGNWTDLVGNTMKAHAAQVELVGWAGQTCERYVEVCFDVPWTQANANVVV